MGIQDLVGQGAIGVGQNWLLRAIGYGSPEVSSSGQLSGQSFEPNKSRYAMGIQDLVGQGAIGFSQN